MVDHAIILHEIDEKRLLLLSSSCRQNEQVRIVDPLLAITLLGVRRDGGRRVVRLDNEYARLETEPTFDQIVVEPCSAL